jgi:hypothetical protein
MRDRARRAVERWLPWYDPEAVARQRRHQRAAIAASVATRRRAVFAIHDAERLRAAYRLAAERLER